MSDKFVDDEFDDDDDYDIEEEEVPLEIFVDGIVTIGIVTALLMREGDMMHKGDNLYPR